MRAGAALQPFTPEHISVYSIYSSVPSVPLRLPPKKMKMDFFIFFKTWSVLPAELSHLLQL